MAGTYTSTRIRTDYLAKLHALARANKRSTMKQLEFLIDDLIIENQAYELASYGKPYGDGSRQATLRVAKR